MKKRAKAQSTVIARYSRDLVLSNEQIEKASY